MCSIVLLKLLATAAGVGLGLPGGVIGPTIVIGAAAGGVVGYIAEISFPQDVSSHAFYAVIGMGAMMSATLQAPLAALTAMVELTANPNIILPGMLAVIVSGLTTSEIFGKQSVFLLLMKARGLDYRNDPVAQSLRRLGVATVMNTSISVVSRSINLANAQAILDKQPQWIIIKDNQVPKLLLPAADLALYLHDRNLSATSDEPGDSAEKHSDVIDLIDIPARRRELATIELRATLQEALDRLIESQAEALCITHHLYGEMQINGVLTKQDIESHYQYKK
jgi:chloride channel protein, CIC family